MLQIPVVEEKGSIWMEHVLLAKISNQYLQIEDLVFKLDAQVTESSKEMEHANLVFHL